MPPLGPLDAKLRVTGTMPKIALGDIKVSVGKAGQRGDPAIADAKKEVFKTAMSMGVQPRAEISSPDDAKEYLDMGVRHFNMAVDISILSSFWQKNGEALRKAVEGA